jgi:uncharacterized protein (TIGR00255 family)
MRSMTGYGRGVGAHGDVRVTVDVRAVNHRFLDLKLRGSALPAALEDALGSRVRGALERGAVVVAVNLSRGGAVAGLAIDGAVAERVHRQLADLAARLGMPGPDLALVLAQPGVVLGGEPSGGAPGDDDAATAAANAALDAALTQLADMRRSEGDALARDLLARLAELDAVRNDLAALAVSLPAQIARRLGERIHRLAAEVAIDDARIAQEVALHADRADVSEELIRLASHLDQARALITGPGAVGRRLDFLVQELGRELNTIGSKSASAEISAAIVGAKATLEKIREQVQNVE